jgi:pimeloyl-ACP methyl ester carboxylesterase
MRPRLRVLTTALVLFAGRTSAAAEGARCLAVAEGECLQVTVAGAGPDVVLIPGLFGSAFGFRRVVPLLNAAGYRTIVVEPLGVGDSSRPANADYSLTAQAERIRLALERLEVKEAVLVSHSVGTSMALRLAARDPGRIRGVVSLEGGPVEEVTTPSFRRVMRLAPLLKLLGAGRVIRGRVRGMLVSRSGDPSWVTDDIVNRYSEGAAKDLGATLDAFAQMSRAREPELLAPRLTELRCPVRLLLGGAQHEGGPTSAEIETLQRNLPVFAITRVPGAGSFLFEEAPAAVVQAVDEVVGLTRLIRTANR